MGPALAKAPARKRNRKRKRRAASSSESESSSSSSSDEDVPTPSKEFAAKTAGKQSSESESESSSSESDSGSSSDSSNQPSSEHLATQQAIIPGQTQHAKVVTGRRSPTPSLPTTTIPSFIPSGGSAGNDAQKEQILKDRFRKFWMASVADGFKDDLEEIRKEPNLGTTRLSLLIESLASGADVFSSSARPEDLQDINEMEVVLEGQ